MDVWKCKFCGFDCDKRALLLRHYRLQHAHQSRHRFFPCLYENCVISSKTLGGLKTHLAKDHSLKRHHNLEQTFKCSLCHLHVSSLITHLNRHLKSSETVECPFKDCHYKTNVLSSFSSHRSRKHSGFGPESFSDTCIIQSLEVFHDDNLSNFDCSDMDATDSDCYEEMSVQQYALKDSKEIERRIALFFLKLESVFHIPMVSVNHIVDEILDVHMLSWPVICNHLKETLSNSEGEFKKEDILKIMDIFLKEYPFVKLLSKTQQSQRGILSSQKLRNHYFKCNFPFVAAAEYEIGKYKGKMCFMTYVSLPAMLQKLLHRADVLDKVLSIEEESGAFQYCTFKDGDVYKKNPFFEIEENRLAIGLYIDEFEVCNPLGTSRKKHKICAVYWVLADIPSRFRSKLHVIQLAALAKSVHLKEFGLKKCLLPLWRDLAFLENEGIFVESLGENLKGTVIYVSADNLGAHQFAGFVESFGPNVMRPCRACMVTNENLQDPEYHLEKSQKRDKENYAYHIQQVRENPALSSIYGLKNECVLHEYLNYFHATEGLPFDISHDLLEGIVPYELALCLAYFISHNFVTLELVNKKIREFPYKVTDRVNQPQTISDRFRVNHTIGGNQSENRTLIRLLPLLLGNNVPVGDPVWAVLLSLKSIVELAHSPVFSDSMLNMFSLKIKEHKQQFMANFVAARIKPKHHYVEHYVEQIKLFGPLVQVSTIRFEAKHNFFKRIVRSVNNFKNILFTLANRHQKMMAYHLASPCYFGEPVLVESHTYIPLSVLSEKVQSVLPDDVVSSSSIMVTDNITLDGTKYSKDMFLLLHHGSGKSQLGEIQNIFLQTKVRFLVRLYSALYDDHFGAYRVTGTEDYKVVQPSELSSYYPLPSYTVNGLKTIVMKHFVLMECE